MSQTKSTTSQKKPATNQKKSDVSKQKPSTNQKNPTVSQKKPVSNTQKPAPKATKAPKTQAFDTVNKKKKAQKSPRERKRIVIAIFVIIILILSALAVILIGNILNKYKDIHNQPEQNPNVTYVEKSADDIKVGDLLLLSQNNPFDYTINGLVGTQYNAPPKTIINLWAYKNNTANNAETKINIPDTEIYAPTYELAGNNYANQICLEETTLHAFNQMMLDYCRTLDLSSHTEGSASKINVAWGWSHENDLINNDIPKYGNAFWNQADGKSITLMKVKVSQEQDRVDEEILIDDFTWIYENAHKYGFINRYPNVCEEHTGFNSEVRVHFRYVGIEHATYIYENNICLDEYLELLREAHGFNNPLTFSVGDKEYQVYYVKYSGNPTQIPVLKDSNYSISGDNMNGFIVTVEK